MDPDAALSSTAGVTSTVTFLFTDIEGSTLALDRLGDAAFAEMLTSHHALIRAAIGAHAGVEVDTAGDGFFVAFPTPSDAIGAALDAQCSLGAHTWPDAAPIRVRMGIHTGEALSAASGFVGLAVHEAARINAVGHGGQVLVSNAAAVLVGTRLPAGATLRSLGMHRLKDLSAPQEIHQLCHPALLADFPALRSLDSRPHNLPAHLTRFVGRQAEIDEVSGLLGGNRLVTLAGAGGAGKTRLSLQAAAAVAERFADGVWLVELAPVSEPDLVPAAVAGALGLAPPAGKPVGAALVDYLRGKDALVVLDNCEHVLAACVDLIAAILSACVDITILATTRESLGIAGEVVWRVPPLDTGLDGPAVALFCERAKRARPDFAPDDDERRAIAEICRRLDGLPLAIELAAARARVLSPKQIAERLDDRFRLLTGGDRVALPRQQTLHAAVEWSHDLLDVSEKIVLRRLAVFAGGFCLEAAEEVCSLAGVDVLDAVTGLVDKSLVVVDHGQSDARYGMLETIRQYAHDRLDEANETMATQASHLAWCQALAACAAPQLRGPGQGEWLDRLEADHDNFRVALEFAAGEPAAVERGLRLAGALHLFLLRRGFFFEALRLVRPLVDRRRLAPVEASVEAVALVASVLGHQNDDRCRQVEEEALAAALAAGDASAAALARFRIGFTLFKETRSAADDSDRVSDGEAMVRAAADEARGLGDRWVLSTILLHLARIVLVRGDDTKGLELAEEALVLASEVGDEWHIGSALVTLGQIRDAQGESETAADHYRACLELSRRLDFAVGVSHSLTGLMILAAKRAAVSEVATTGSELCAVDMRLGDRVGLATRLRVAAHHLCEAGEADAAAQWSAESVRLLRSAEQDFWLAVALLTHADVLCAQQRWSEAESHVLEARDLVEGLGDDRLNDAITSTLAAVALGAEPGAVSAPRSGANPSPR